MYDKVIKVLLIEDDEDDYLLTRDMLSEIPSGKFELTWAATYQEALELIRRNKHDVCLIDYRLGEHNGIDLLRAACVGECAMPAIVLTAQDDHDIDLKVMMAGAADYLVKGRIDRAALERSIRYTLEHWGTVEALRASEQKYRQIVETSMEGIWLLDSGARTIYVNRRMAEMLGYTVEEMHGRSLFDFMDASVRSEAARGFERRKGGAAEQHEFRFRRNDGAELWAIVSTNSIFDSCGNFTGALGMVTDITESKRAAAAHARLAAIVESSEDAIIGKTLDGIITNWNKGAEKIYGYRAEEVLGKHISLHVPPERRHEITEILKNVRQGRGISLYETVRVKKDGEPIHVSLTVSPILDDAGNIMGAAAIARDITERRRAEEALREADQRALREYERLMERVASLAQTLGTARDLITIYRALADFTVASMPCSSIFLSLYDETEMVRRVVYLWYGGSERNISELDVVPVGDGPAGQAIKTGRIIAYNDFQDALKGGIVVSSGFDDDPREPRSAVIAPMVIMGRTVGTVEVQSYDPSAYTNENLTAMCLAANLAASAIENVRLLEQERERAVQLQQSQKMHAIGRLAGGVAHDFNNLLTAITGYSDLSLRRLPPDNPLRRNIEEIKRAASRAADLTHQLLAFSRKQILQPRVLELNAIISGMEKMLRRLIGEDVELLLDLVSSLGRVKADPGQLEQVMMNLVVNARDAMPSGGKLTIQTANVYLDEEYARQHVAVVPGPYVLLAVSDNGCGMDTATQAQIFEPFFTTKEQGKGTGLGLSTVYGIVKQSQGNIWVYSEVGQGTTFKVYLPRVEEGVEALRSNEGAKSLAEGTETILLVEDDDMVRTIARTILQQAGYTVLEAPDGETALSTCRHYEGTIHLVMTDVVMPRMSGRVVADQLKQLRPDLSVIFMSGYTEEAIVHHGVLHEGVNFMEKPFTPDTLTHKVREVLEGAKAGVVPPQA